MSGNTKIAIIAAILFVSAGLVAVACQVPVFRYALERWPSDMYSIRVVSSGELSASDAGIVKYLQDAKNNADFLPNFLFETAASESEGKPQLEVYYPRKNRRADAQLIWKGDLTSENAMKAVDSPARRELVKRVLSGESVVWVFLASGNTETDQGVRETLKTTLAKAGETISVPEGVVTNADAETNGFSGDPEDVVSSGVPLKIDFSVMEISRDDPAEEILTAMLLNLEDDLYEFSDSPMVFPVFGRGRALEPLIGRGINADTIFEYCGYLCGACSCEVKDQNPGMDLLVSTNWDSAIEGSSAFLEKTLPPLEGTAALTGGHQVEPVVDSVVVAKSSPWGVWVLVTGLVLVGLVVGSFLIKRNSNI